MPQAPSTKITGTYHTFISPLLLAVTFAIALEGRKSDNITKNMHRMYKRLKLGSSQAYDCSSD
jgi:hypothetical protein